MRYKVILLTLADFLVNLSAGWFVIAVTIPFSSNWPTEAKFGLLLVNLGLSIICFVVAVWLRKGKK